MSLNLARASKQPRTGRKRIEFSSEQLQKMAMRYRDGEALLALSLDYGVTTDVIALRLRDMGVTIRPPHRQKRVTNG